MSNYSIMNINQDTHKTSKKGRPVLREHVVAFAFALILVAGGLLLFSKNGWSLLADITSFSGQSGAKVADLPMVYQITNGALEIKSTKHFTNVKAIHFYVIYDAENIILQLENATSPYEYTYAASSENMIFVTLFPKVEIQPETIIYTLPLNGIVDGITISDMTVSWESGWIEKIAIQKK